MSGWTTADYALIVSIASAAVSIASFVWNVWSKFIYPKPRIAVSIGFMSVIDQHGSASDLAENVISLSATNYGPGEATLYCAVAEQRRTKICKPGKQGMLNTLENWPIDKEYTLGPFSGGLPKKVGVGEQFTVHLTPYHEHLAEDPIVRVGFHDTFGRKHWAPRKQVARVRDSVRKYIETHKRPARP
jgi:hypothetical protein